MFISAHSIGVARWDAPGDPGRFQLKINGKPLETTFGTEGKDWQWQYGGEVSVDQKSVKLSLHDLTGFDGRCDAVYFTTNKQNVPPNAGKVLFPDGVVNCSV